MNSPTQQLQTLLKGTSDLSRRLALLIGLATELQEINPEQGLVHAREAIETAARLGDEEAAGEAEMLAGQILRVLGREKEAIRLLESAVARFETLGLRNRLAYAHYHLGGVCVMANMLEPSLRHITKASELFKQLGDRYGQAKALQGSSISMQKVGRQKEAIELTKAASEIYRQLPDKQLDLGYSLFNIASQMTDVGEAAQTVPYLLEAVAIARAVSKTRLLTYALGQIGVAYTARKDYVPGRTALAEAMDLARSLNDPVAIAWTYLHMADLELEAGPHELAEKYYLLSLEVGRSHSMRDCAVRCHKGLNEIYERHGDLGRALIHFKAFHELKVTLVEEGSNRSLQQMQTMMELDLAQKEKEILERSQHELGLRVHERTQELSSAIRRLKDEIEERKKVEEQVRFLAERDYLTGCVNRAGLFNRLRVMVEAARSEDTDVWVLFIDLDRFKQINDALGHHIGDQVLGTVAKRLQHCIDGAGLLCRYGGDEFVCVVPDPDRHGGLDRFIERITLVFAEPFQAGRESVFLSCSIGASAYPEHGTDAESLINHADFAMYSVKQKGRNSFAVFDFQIIDADKERLAIQKQLRGALQRNELMLYYQPKVNINTGAITGVEALLRWQHPEMGMVSPGKFIPVAEDSGQIIEIGKWVTREACHQIRLWKDMGISNLSVAVNLSVRQLQDQSLVAGVKEALAENGLGAGVLEVEVTESILIDQREHGPLVLSDLQGAGVTIALDDFGTGYSNLSYLERLPINSIKIDKSFVNGILRNQRDRAIIEAVATMARSLGVKVVAEGVEFKGQLDALAETKCDEYQGYLFSEARPAAEITRMVLQNRGTPRLHLVEGAQAGLS